MGWDLSSTTAYCDFRVFEGVMIKEWDRESGSISSSNFLGLGPELCRINPAELGCLGS